MSDVDFDKLKSVYDQLCSSYQEIDSFRAQLLGRLPLATGAGGIFLLYASNGTGTFSDDTKAFLPAIGVFGFIVTLGLFAYEIYGIKKCHALIRAGTQMEYQLGIDGQFAHRPRSVWGQINEPFAAGVIYPAVLAAWAYLVFAFAEPHSLSWTFAASIFFIGFASSMYYNNWLKLDGKRTDLLLLNQRILKAEEDGDVATILPLLADNFTMVNANGSLHTGKEFLNTLPANAHRNRSGDQVDVRRYDHFAVITYRLTTTCEEGDKKVINRFWTTQTFIQDPSKSNDMQSALLHRIWKTRLFIQNDKREFEHWLWTRREVMEIPDESSL